VGSSKTDIDPKRVAETDIKSIREVRQNYAVVNDPELDRLTAALAQLETDINNVLAADSHQAWKMGTIVSARAASEFTATPAQIFLLDDPENWITTTAKSILRTSILAPSDASITIFYSELQAGHINTAKNELRRLCGLRVSDADPTEHIASVIDDHDGELHGAELANIFTSDFIFPPAIVMAWVALFVADNDSEIEFIVDSGEIVFVSKDNISEQDISTLSPVQIHLLRTNKSNHWDAVLSFLQLIVPHANSTRYGGGRNSDIEEFQLQLDTVCDRVKMTSPAMRSLEYAAGASDRPLTSDDGRLIEVLSAFSWIEFVAQARNVFGSVLSLRSALSQAAMRWAAVESAPEIEKAIHYLDQVDFGRFDHTLAIERQLIRSRIDLMSIVENPSRWLSIQDEFERWRQDYRRAYLEDHAQKRDRHRQLRQRIVATTKQVEQLELLERIDVVHLGTIDELAELWDQTIRLFSVCENEGSNIGLIDMPVCADCGARLGQPPNHTDVADMISEVDKLFNGYRDRLASVVANLVIVSPETDKLVSLFRLNSAGDLSDLANVLDDKVISFLNELFGKPSGSSGNIDDWTSPHS
jgi:hypothetical protein